MDEHDPITQWLADLRTEHQAAAEALWRRYWHRVEGIARRTLGAAPHAEADVEDVAQSAFRSFFARARVGRFPRLEDRHDLFKLLATITIRKAIKRKHRQSRQPISSSDLVESILCERTSHESAVAATNEIERLVNLLDTRAQQVLALVLEGHTSKEIADKCGVAVSTIERKRKLIRETWLREMRA